MATHDYVIDNQTAPNFRADLNNALLAIVSNNSSATAPAVTYANMMWYDTAANILYMRNEDNDGWIALGTLDQTADTFAAAVALASQAEAEAGTNNTKVMTPLRVAQAIADFGAQSLTAAGYKLLPGGLIVQWGIAADNATTSFPIAFPNSCFIVLTGFPSNTSTNGITFGQAGSAFSNTGVTVNPAGIDRRFFAIGH